jgi:hypothetical protein
MGIIDTVVHANDFFDMKPWEDRVEYAFRFGEFSWDIILGCTRRHNGKEFIYLFTDQQLAYLQEEFRAHGQPYEVSLRLYYQNTYLRPRPRLKGIVAGGIIAQLYYLSFESANFLDKTKKTKSYTCFSLEYAREEASAKRYFFNSNLLTNFEDYSALADDAKKECLRILLKTLRKRIRGILPIHNWLYYFSRKRYDPVGLTLIHRCCDHSDVKCDIKELLADSHD